MPLGDRVIWASDGPYAGQDTCPKHGEEFVVRGPGYASCTKCMVEAKSLLTGRIEQRGQSSLATDRLRIAALTYAGYAARLLPDCLVGPTLESDAEDAAWERGKAGLLPDSAEYERGRQSVLALVRERRDGVQADLDSGAFAPQGVMILACLSELDGILRACGEAAAGE